MIDKTSSPVNCARLTQMPCPGFPFAGARVPVRKGIERGMIYHRLKSNTLTPLRPIGKGHSAYNEGGGLHLCMRMKRKVWANQAREGRVLGTQDVEKKMHINTRKDCTSEGNSSHYLGNTWSAQKPEIFNVD